MPKLIPQRPSLSQRLAGERQQEAEAQEHRKRVGKADPTDRAKQVQAIWNSIPAPSLKFDTEAEQEAYQQGVLDEKCRQSEYDYQLREAGLR